MSRLRFVYPALVLIALNPTCLADGGSRGPIKAADLKEFLTFIASDDLEGRNAYSEGFGIAAQYVAERLKSWGVKPGGDNGSYFQRVAVVGVKATDNSTITVETNGQTRTFKNGDGMTIARPVGGKRTITTDKIEFIGYGLSVASAGVDDYAGVDVKGKVAVWLGTRGPEKLGNSGFRLMGGRAGAATNEHGAIAGIGPGFGGGGRRGGGGAPPTGTPPAGGAAAGAPQPQRGGGGGGGGFGQTQFEAPDFTTPEKYDGIRAPSVGAQDDFLEFLFSGQDTKYAALKEKATARGDLPHFSLKNIKITFNIDCDYRVTRTQYTRNVVGIVDGRDKKLRDTYVAFGAHLDHVGYAEGEIIKNDIGERRQDAKGRVTPGTISDRIWNGADDDGSGTVTLLSLAKAYAKGPKPKRSLLFVWHAGEEKGLWGSRFFADHPEVPIENIVAQLNIDMIGRNRDNKAEEADTVYIVGSDRISTELHNLIVGTNTSLQPPLKLSYEMNDPADPESIYTRSDHYSYASKGIPIAFFTTGLHPDYHANTDSVEKILFDKMARIGTLVYQAGMRVANLDHAPKRDNKGPRVNKTVTGTLAE